MFDKETLKPTYQMVFGEAGVCEPMNEKGVLRVQLPGKKIWINHKRVKLQVAAAELYPEDYDFLIIDEKGGGAKDFVPPIIGILFHILHHISE